MSVDNDPNVIYGGDIEDADEEEKEVYATLGDQIMKSLKRGENNLSFVNAKSGKSWTFRDMLDQSIVMAKTLHGYGIKQNDVISIISENRHEFPALAFGAFFLNATVAPNSVSYSERELMHALELSKPKVVFVSPFAAKKTVAVCRKLKFVRNVILIGGRKFDNFAFSLDELVKKYGRTNFDVESYVQKQVEMNEQIALIMCSSGTTGLPKGVMITQNNMVTVMNIYKGNFKLTRMVFDSTLMITNIAPWFHAYGFLSMYMVACSGEAVFVFMSKYEDELFLKSIEKYKVNIITVVPPVMVMLAKSPLFDKYDLSSIKHIGCGAAVLSRDIEDQVKKRFNDEIMIRQGYGMSETTLSTLGTGPISKPGSVGEVLKGVYAKVIDANGKSLGPNKPGELCFKGGVIMKGYINDKNATDSTIDKDGWLHSGDIGYYDEDKQFYIVDRIKELIKYKAFQVPPAEIEGLLLSNPKIKDCGVIGIPDEASGELPFAFVVKQPGVTLTEQEVKDFVAENASKAKWLRGGVKFIKEIPKNQGGKLLRRELKEIWKNSRAKL